MNKILIIDGMTCAACSSAVERILNRKEEIVEASVNLSTNSLNIMSVYNSDGYTIALDEEEPEQLQYIKQLDYDNRVFLTPHQEALAYINIYLFILFLL